MNRRALTKKKSIFYVCIEMAVLFCGNYYERPDGNKNVPNTAINFILVYLEFVYTRFVLSQVTSITVCAQIAFDYTSFSFFQKISASFAYCSAIAVNFVCINIYAQRRQSKLDQTI